MDLLLHTFTIRGGHVVSLVEFRPVVWEEIAYQTDMRTTDAQTHRKVMLPSHTLTMRGSDAASLDEFRGLGGDSVMDRWTDDSWAEGQMHRNIYVALTHEVLRPSQPNGVMSSAVSLPNHTFTGQA